jgi:hypothetical protein
MMKQKLLIQIASVLLVILIPAVLFAQPGPGDDPDVPIDGGLSLLLAAGVAYGAKKGYDVRKKKQPNEESSLNK